jgi:RNA polymerase sigma factor (sigma-70 family)
MARRITGSEILSPLCVLAHVGVVGGLPDRQLVERFLNGSDDVSEAAFSALVHRHGPMVLRVCRQILSGVEDAEDAFQATFLVLARRAASVRRTESIASWLHGAAQHIALRAREAASRRKFHEGQTAAMRITSTSHIQVHPDDWAELHEEIARLPGRYKEPILLCYFEGLSTAAAAARLGCAQGTILARLSRARQRLQRNLARRGVIETDALPPQLQKAGPAPVVVPLGLLVLTVRSSLAFVGRRNTDALGSTTVVTLANRGMSAMMIAKWKPLAVLSMVCIVASGWMQPTGGVDGQLAVAGQETSSQVQKRQASRTSEFPYALKFLQGATRFLEGDKIVIEEIRGTAETMMPGNIYWIKGTYTLASHDRAMLAAFTTATTATEGTGPYLKVQTATVDRGSGTFTLFLPMAYKGYPHVSFYPVESGSDFGGNYVGTGDSVLKEWWGSKKAK